MRVYGAVPLLGVNWRSEHAGGQAFMAISPETPLTVTSSISLDGVTQDPRTSGVLHVEYSSSYAPAVSSDGTTV